MSKTILVETTKEVLKRFFSGIKTQNISQEERERMSEALVAIQRATIRTRNFIRNKGYESNEELSELWTIALKKAIDANIKDLPDYLFHKAKFWGQPKDWLREKSSMELVPKLKFLEEECEMIIVKLK